MKKVTKSPRQRQFWRSCRALALALFALLLPACGGSGAHPGAAGAHPDTSASPPTSSGQAIPLRQRPAPPGWPRVRISSGAVLSYPPGWRRVRSDRGTASAALLGSAGQIVGYLNVTPRQGGETLADWPAFRVTHNAREGDRRVTREAVAVGIRFLSGPGTCVRDSYETVTRAHYIELACIVHGARATTVIVGAAAPSSWPAVSAQLYRALSALIT
jgi:hypothetical protein